jgi:hypothetical protein
MTLNLENLVEDYCGLLVAPRARLRHAAGVWWRAQRAADAWLEWDGVVSRPVAARLAAAVARVQREVRRAGPLGLDWLMRPWSGCEFHPYREYRRQLALERGTGEDTLSLREHVTRARDGLERAERYLARAEADAIAPGTVCEATTEWLRQQARHAAADVERWRARLVVAEWRLATGEARAATTSRTSAAGWLSPSTARREE